MNVDAETETETGIMLGFARESFRYTVRILGKWGIEECGCRMDVFVIVIHITHFYGALFIHGS